jgi:hypothetical protein
MSRMIGALGMLLAARAQARAAGLERRIADRRAMLAQPIYRGTLREAPPLALSAPKPPCGECHLRPGEVCDVCGAAESQ